MPTILTGFLGIFSLLVVLSFFLARLDVAENISPQGCRMSWMSPSYVLQDGFDISWTPLARRYSLWLYREVGWDPAQTGNGVPVLFVPGNAGSSHQVRSIASSATRQYYSSPYVVSPEFASRAVKPLDFFAVEFNEDLSAFHGTTLELQIAYTSKAISYITSLYPPNTTIIVMGHSMGGVVAASLLPSPQISSIITMSTPYTLPPARFDSRIDTIYSRVRVLLDTDSTPILSICGGATDMMIPSESCILPAVSDGLFRRTVFTSALEGAWTGVGHREMVWCHQVRWRVARAALELGSFATAKEQSRVLDKWLRDGHTLPPDVGKFLTLDGGDIANAKILPPDQNLILKYPQGSTTYILPLRWDTTHCIFTLLVSRGSINSVSPQNPIPLRVSVHHCIRHSTSSYSDSVCAPLKPDALKLIPNPISGTTFPVPGEGSDESEGVVLYEVDLSSIGGLTGQETFIVVKIEGGNGEGWVVAGFSASTPIISSTGNFALLFGGVTIPVPKSNHLRSSYAFPKLLSHALFVYRIISTGLETADCPDVLFPPLLMHTSNHAQETHYFPLTGSRDRRTLLHTHLPAPFISSSRNITSGIHFAVYSSVTSECHRGLDAIKILIDWPATAGRWASRYWTTIVAWAVGVVALTLFFSWETNDVMEQIPTVSASLDRYGGMLFRRLLIIFFLFSFVPFPKSYFLGNDEEVELSLIAPLILLISSGLVVLSWWLLSLLMFSVRIGSNRLSTRKLQEIEIGGVSKNTLVSIALLFLAILLFVPWQVAFLGTWIFHLYTCATHTPTQLSRHKSPTAIPLQRRSDDIQQQVEEVLFQSRSLGLKLEQQINLNFSMHILLLMTWLLPLVAPIMVVWVRTLVTAGLTTPFDGDHNFLNVAPFLVLVDFASWTPGQLFEHVWLDKRISIRWFFAGIAASAFMIGSRSPYAIFNLVNLSIGAIVCLKVGRRYWDGTNKM